MFLPHPRPSAMPASLTPLPGSRRAGVQAILRGARGDCALSEIHPAPQSLRPSSQQQPGCRHDRGARGTPGGGGPGGLAVGFVGDQGTPVPSMATYILGDRLDQDDLAQEGCLSTLSVRLPRLPRRSSPTLARPAWSGPPFRQGAEIVAPFLEGLVASHTAHQPPHARREGTGGASPSATSSPAPTAMTHTPPLSFLFFRLYLAFLCF